MSDLSPVTDRSVSPAPSSDAPRVDAPASGEASWMCIQLGTRERYCVPRGLASQGALGRFIVDAWVPPGSPFGRLPTQAGARLRQRYTADMAGVRVEAFTAGLLALELAGRARGLDSRAIDFRRNDWFQQRAGRALAHAIEGTDAARTLVYSYSYASDRIFPVAKQAGARTVLGQFDPGPHEDRINAGLHARHPHLRTSWKPHTSGYLAAWHEEVALSDAVVVNSEWSRQALGHEGVPLEKVHVIPLAYTPPARAIGFERTYPDAFTAARPMRVLFLGQVILRKGVAELLDAAQRLRGAPVEITVVGRSDIEGIDALAREAGVRLVSAVTREEVDAFYQRADVFLLPTHSDGFALTQLEAQAWRLPVVATPFCGDVVTDGANGVVLPEVTPEAIAEALLGLAAAPERLAAMAAAATTAGFTIDAFGERLVAVGETLVRP